MSQRANPNEVLAIFAKHYKKFRDFKDVSVFHRLVLLVIGREVSAPAADTALRRIEENFVDWNEVRLARIDELKTAMRDIGAADLDSRALRLREMLGKVFTERHMLDAEFLREEDREKRAAFLAGIPGLDYAQCQTLEASLLAEKQDIPVSSQAQRVAQRLGWLPKGKDAAIAKVKAALLEAARGDSVNLTYGLVRIAEDFCHARNPECPRCPLHGLCPAAKQFKEAGGKREVED